MKKVFVLLLFTRLYAAAFAQNASDFTIDGNGIITAYKGWDTAVVIPAQIGGRQVTGIGDKAFISMDLTGVTFPQGIKSIGQEAFSNNKLTSLSLPDGVSVGVNAFTNNQSLTSLTIGNNVTVGSRAFAGNQLTALTIGDSVSIASEAFSGNQLTRLTMGSNCSVGNSAFSNNKLTSLSLPDGVSIGAGAFTNNQLTSVTIGNNVSIGARAFAGNMFSDNRLATLTIGNGVSIAPEAFSGNPLTSLAIGSGGSIGNNAFANHRLTNITLGANINFIDFDYAALGRGVYYDYYCNERKAGTYNASANYPSKNNGDYTFIEGRYGVVFIEYKGSGGNRLIIPRELNGTAVKGIGDRAFREKNISRMQLPDGLVFIGREAFYGNALTSLTMPNSVAYIGTGAFHGNELTELGFAGNRRVIIIEARDSRNDGWGDSWNGEGALRISVNGANFQYLRAVGPGGKDFLFAGTGDEVVFYWVAGSSQGENSFVVYYSDNPPNPELGTTESGKILLYKNYGDLTNTTNGERLGSFTVLNVNQPIVTYDADGGTPAPSAVAVENGSKINQPPAMTRTGWTFDKWYTDPARTTAAAFPITVTGNVNLYAKWTGRTGSTGIELIRVEGGSFQMGSNDRQDFGASPPHTVTLTGFYIGKYPVTQDQYQAVMGSNPSNFKSTPASGEAQGRRPVENVTWYDAVEFCNKLSAKEGLQPVYTISGRTPTTGYPITGGTVTPNTGANGYRLPTEAQWEYAARGGNGSPGNYTYAGSNNIGNVAWYSENSNGMTHEVGKKAPNGLGIYDMSGNVWEWCWDWYGDYSSSAQTNPVGAVSGALRVMRGGSWFNPAENVRSAYRYYFDPLYRYVDFGFRLVRP